MILGTKTLDERTLLALHGALIFEFRFNGHLLAKERATEREDAVHRFSHAFPEWRGELASGAIKVTSRAPAY